MSVDVDDVWLYELILSYLKKVEEQSPVLVRESPHFSNGDRKVIVQWISKLVKTFKIGTEAHHLAVFLFDYFIADHQADAQGLYLIGSACFSVACKVNDVEINVPQASKILRLAPFESVMQSCLLKSTEILVLQHFNWNVLKPTEASFLEYYAASCLAIELECIEDIEYANNFAKYYNKWITYFREKVLLNDQFRNHRPSKVASSIVISTRISMALFPEWPDFMVHLTGWYKSNLTSIVNNLRSGLRSDLMMEKYSDLYEQSNKLPNINQIIYYDSKCGNRGDIDIVDSSSMATTDDNFLKFASSENSGNFSNLTAPNETSLEIPNEYIVTTIHMNENQDNSKNNPYQLSSSSYYSVNMTNSQLSLFNSNQSDQEVALSALNANNEQFLSRSSSLEYVKSVDSLTTTCDLSLDMPSNQYSSNYSYFGKPFQSSTNENINQSYDDVNPLSNSLSSSSIYLIISQNDSNNYKRQVHSKHCHSVVVEPIPLVTRRTQNRDSMIANSVNNGYYSLKKRAPGLVINVNGGGSSYSLNLHNNFTKDYN